MEDTRKRGTSSVPGFLILLACVAFTVGGMAILSEKFKANPSYRPGWELAKNDPAVIALLGSPVKDIPWVSGKLKEYADGRYSARLQTFIYGPKARGLLLISGEGENDIGQSLYMEIRIGGKIVLIYSSSQPEKGFYPYTPPH